MSLSPGDAWGHWFLSTLTHTDSTETRWVSERVPVGSRPVLAPRDWCDLVQVRPKGLSRFTIAPPSFSRFDSLYVGFSAPVSPQLS